MTQKIDKIQKETIKDIQAKLKEHSKCLLVRPTGFGKTTGDIWNCIYNFNIHW